MCSASTRPLAVMTQAGSAGQQAVLPQLPGLFRAQAGAGVAGQGRRSAHRHWVAQGNRRWRRMRISANAIPSPSTSTRARAVPWTCPSPARRCANPHRGPWPILSEAHSSPPCHHCSARTRRVAQGPRSPTMSDSDAEPAPALPPDAKIEQALRRLVRDLWLAGDHDNLTVKRIRKSAEEQLRLPDDFFRDDSTWKDRSKTVITDQVVSQLRFCVICALCADLNAMQSVQERDGAEGETAEPEEPPKKKRAPKAASAQKRKPSTKKQTAAPTKSSGRKRQKVSISDAEDEDPAVRSDASEPSEPSTKKPTKKSRVVEEDSEGDGGASPAPRPSSKRKGSPQSGPADDFGDDTNAQERSTSPVQDAKPAASDSEMSVLIDEPPKKKRQKKAGPTKEKQSKSTSKKSKPKDEKELDPQDAEIKRLQGWLVKCGIRKLWGKELKPFDTPKARINHLKEMLKEVGMDGRYSVEKARQIKERRELAADLEAVQEGAKRWGQSESDEEDGRTQPKRRLAKGLKDLEGLIESEGEETD